MPLRFLPNRPPHSRVLASNLRFLFAAPQFAVSKSDCGSAHLQPAFRDPDVRFSQTVQDALELAHLEVECAGLRRVSRSLSHPPSGWVFAVTAQQGRYTPMVCYDLSSRLEMFVLTEWGVEQIRLLTLPWPFLSSSSHRK